MNLPKKDSWLRLFLSPVIVPEPCLSPQSACICLVSEFTCGCALPPAPYGRNISFSLWVSPHCLPFPPFGPEHRASDTRRAQ